MIIIFTEIYHKDALYMKKKGKTVSLKATKLKLELLSMTMCPNQINT